MLRGKAISGPLANRSSQSRGNTLGLRVAVGHVGVSNSIRASSHRKQLIGELSKGRSGLDRFGGEFDAVVFSVGHRMRWAACARNGAKR